MNKTKKIALIATIPVLAFFLSGCGKTTVQKDTTPPAAPGISTSQQNAQTDTTTPAPTLTVPAPAQQDAASADAAKQQANLPALPSDDTTAIDTELNNMDKELKTTDNSLNQNDMSDSQLGL